jgi:hypothetical protein
MRCASAHVRLRCIGNRSSPYGHCCDTERPKNAATERPTPHVQCFVQRSVSAFRELARRQEPRTMRCGQRTNTTVCAGDYEAECSSVQGTSNTSVSILVCTTPEFRGSVCRRLLKMTARWTHPWSRTVSRKAFDLRDTVFEESYPAQPRFGGWHCVSDFLSADSESFTDS